MGLKAAAGQLVLMVVLLTGCALYTHHHVNSLTRADFTQQEYFEDSKAGNGTRYRVLTRASDTQGASFTVEVLSRAGVLGFLPNLSGSTPEHSHTQGQAEEVAVISGRLGYMLGGPTGTRGELGPGESLIIPPGKQHVLLNADNATDLLYSLSHRPAGPRGEAFFEDLAGLGWDYGSLDRIHPLQVLVLFDGSGSQLSDLSGLMAPLVRHVLLPVSRLLGFKDGYPSHRSRGGASSSSSTQPGLEGQTSDSSGRDEL